MRTGDWSRISRGPGMSDRARGRFIICENGVWDPRPLMLGQSRFDPAEFSDVTVTAFVSPDSSDEVFTSAVNCGIG